MTNKYTDFLDGILTDIPADIDPELFAPFFYEVFCLVSSVANKDGFVINGSEIKPPTNYEEFREAVNLLEKSINMMFQ